MPLTPFQQSVKEILDFFETTNPEEINRIHDANQPALLDVISHTNTKHYMSWGETLQQCLNAHCKELELVNRIVGYDKDYERIEILDKKNNEIIGNLFAITLHFRDNFYGPRCSVWITDTEDFSLQPVMSI